MDVFMEEKESQLVDYGLRTDIEKYEIIMIFD